jgi:superfamily II DNA or RNA helicase
MLIDNRTHGTLQDALRGGIRQPRIASILTSQFSLFAFQALSDHLGSLEQMRLLTPSAGDQGLSPDFLLGMTDLPGDRHQRNRLLTPHVAHKCHDWMTEHLAVRCVSVPTPANLIHLSDGDGQSMAIQGSSAFTSTGLGLSPAVEYEMNTRFDDPEQAGSLLNWFDQIWDDAAITTNVKSELLDWIGWIYAPNAPERIYFQSLRSLFFENLDELDEDRIIKPRTGIRDTLVWNKLYRFQRDGVLGAIDKIERFNGCIIADSVGLGKTFEALAIIKYYELRNDRVLVLAPKKLRENWTIYTVNDKRNLFAEDRFNYDVLNHTDLTRSGGRSGEMNLETINWGNYDLVVIDESHNFRNNPPRKDGMTRYSRLMKDIIRSGVKTKVLMLSATPVNSRMNDLKNQVAFITEGKDDALYHEGVGSIEQTLRQAQAKFNVWLKLDAAERNTSSLLEALNFDYFKLLDLLTIARSRKHIVKYYTTSDIGKFPDRAKPINIKADIDIEGRFPELREINRDIRRLNLSAYAPLKYVLPEKLEEYSRRYDSEVSGGSVFKQIDREESLIHLIRVNLLKRMESSINSFAITVERLLTRVRDYIARLRDHRDGEIDEMSIEDVELESGEFDPYLIGTKIKVLIKDADQIRWKQELEEDEELLVGMLREARQITAARDAKLSELKDLIQRKVDSPLNGGNRKLLIFTAFADTAEYLYSEIAEWGRSSLGLQSALVTGTSDRNKTTVKGLRRDLSSIITAFSPLSKERDKIDDKPTDDIDLLIATDCISEGQNLQDCDYVVNYDIHWNPVRIIQRFGRVDRLGSCNQTIQLVNFWPNMELDEYINLEARVSGRMVLLDISATGEENIIEETQQDQMNDLEYRRRQFHQLYEEVIDMENLTDGISLTDMTLNDFRMDLSEFLKQHGGQEDHVPLGMVAVTTIDDLVDDEMVEPGAIFCLRSENARVKGDPSYALAPHYLVYVSDSGEVCLNFTQTRRILDIFKKLTLGRSQPDDAALACFNALTRDGADMGHYQSLLAKAVAAITGKAEEQGVESLFKRGGTVISKDTFKGIDDFEVVAYLIVKPAQSTESRR